MILNDNSTQQINTLVIQLQNRITNLSNELNKKVSEINDKISDLDTLKKEIADLVKDQINVDSSMNTQITENKNNIATNASAISALNTQIQTNKDNIETNTSDISTLKTSVAGKADKNHTHTKSDITDFPTSLKNPNALTVNGKTYDGSTAVDAGVQTVANGGTGVTTQADINKAFIGNLAEGTSDVTDGTEFVSSYASNNGFSAPEAVNDPFRRKFSAVWGYIKGKISSVLGLTKDNYGGTADMANNGTFGMLGGAKQAESDNFEDLLNNELCSNQTGGLRGGSIHVQVGQEAKNLGIPVDKWYNFLYIPHRTGIGGDNNMYGTLFVTTMISNDGTFYIIHRVSGHNYTANRFNSAT